MCLIFCFLNFALGIYILFLLNIIIDYLGTRSYDAIFFEKIKRKFIKELVIWSKIDLYDIDLELFLLLKGYDLYKMQIYKSKILYR